MRTAVLLVSLAVVAIGVVNGCPYLSHRAHLRSAHISHGSMPTLPNGHPAIETDEQQVGTIGPDCTQLAHNDYLPPSGQCVPDSNPPMYGPTLQDYPSPSDIPQPTWPAFYELDWTFWFINDFTTTPPFDTAPPNWSAQTSGHTYYDEEIGQRERYDSHCISIFVDGPLAPGNFSCDFVILNAKKTAYLVLHDDRPYDAPECCLIGQPFHAPPRDFIKNVYLHKWSQQPTENVTVDWGGITLPEAGLFMYGFNHQPYTYTVGPSNSTLLTTSEPYAFYFTGMPFEGASWQYQKFDNFNPSERPVEGSFDVPASCATAVVCPGWS